MKKKKSRPGMMHSIKPMDKTTICPVCGYDNLKEGPFDEYGYPTYEICPCCGFEFGFSDESEGNSYESYRTDWIRKGFPWFSGRTPKLWNKKLMEKQLENLNLQNQIKHITEANKTI
jgi:transcription elongation factor Elf1